MNTKSKRPKRHASETCIITSGTPRISAVTTAMRAMAFGMTTIIEVVDVSIKPRLGMCVGVCAGVCAQRPHAHRDHSQL